MIPRLSLKKITAIVGLAQQHLEQGKHAEAIRLLRPISTAETDFPIPEMLALAYNAQGNFTKVIELLEPSCKDQTKKPAAEMVELLASAHYRQGHFSQTIELLEPLYQSQPPPNLSLVKLLADAYANIPAQQTKAFPLLKVLFLSDKKEIKENNNYSRVLPALSTLSKIVGCTDNMVMVSFFVEEGLKISKDYSHTKTDAEKKDINTECHNLYFNAGVVYASTLKKYKLKTFLEKDEQKSTLTNEQLLQKEIEFFAKSIEYYETTKKYFNLALFCKPRDLETLLHLAIIIACHEEDIDSALNILLTHNNLHRDNSNYHFALAALYKCKNNSKAAEYHESKFNNLSDSRNPKLIDLFTNFSYIDPNNTVFNQSISAYSQGNYAKAREILAPLFASNPYHYQALILAAKIEAMSKNNAEAIKICDTLMLINTNCVIAFKIKITCLWRMEPNKQKEAVDLCEKHFQNGHTNETQLDILTTYYYYDNPNDQLFLFYASEHVKINKSTITYYMLGLAHFQTANFDEALKAFQQAKSLDSNDFNNGIVSLHVIHCLFLLARTKTEFINCAKKLRSFISYQGPTAHASLVEIMTTAFKELNIDIVTPSTENKSNCEEKKEEDEQDADWVVPPEIKEKILALMPKISYESDKEFEEKTDSDHAEEIPENLVSIGPHLKAYISPKVTLTSGERNKFQTALEKGTLLPEKSKGHSGPKIAGDTYKIKISGSGARLFAKKIIRVGDDTIIAFGKLKPNHMN